MLLKLSFFFVADPCHHYSNLSEANRNTKTEAKEVLCDSQLRKGWYRFVGAAGTRMPTERVEAFSCGTNWPGWLTTTHPTVEEGEFRGVVCFSDRSTGCQYSKTIFVKKCGSYIIYNFFQPPNCDSRYCGTDWMSSEKNSRNKRTYWSSGTRASGILFLWILYDDDVLLICEKQMHWISHFTNHLFRKNNHK